jgi:sialidase-1
MLASTCRSEDQLFETTDVFPARTGGYHHVRIPGIVVSNKGTVLAFGEARHADQGGGDWADIDIVLRRSTDGAKSWGPVQLLEDGTRFLNQRRNTAARRKAGQENFVTCNNPVMIVDQNSDAIHFLYCIEYDRCFYCRTTDDGATFSEPVEITTTFEAFRPKYDWKVLATGPGHGIQLANGRLVVPVWLSTGEGGGGHRPSCVSTIYSDDHGKSWKSGEIVVNHPDLVNPSETVAAERSNGQVMLNIRSENDEHRRAIAFSDDGSTNWTKPKFDEEVYEPVCMASLLRLSTVADGGKNRLLFCNPFSTEPRDSRPGNSFRKRQNLTVRLSYDEGQTWPITKVLDKGDAGYSDLAAGPDGSIYCLYERGGSRTAFDPEALLCTKFNISWLTDGGDSWPTAKRQ